MHLTDARTEPPRDTLALARHLASSSFVPHGPFIFVALFVAPFLFVPLGVAMLLWCVRGAEDDDDLRP